MPGTEARFRSQARSRHRRGGYAVEFALVLPVLLAVMATVIDYGWFFFQQTMAVHAVGEAARTAAMVEEGGAGTQVAVDLIAEHMATAGVDCGSGSVSCTVEPDYSDSEGMRVLRVDLSIDFAGLIGFVPVPLTIHARSSAMLEEQTADRDGDCPDDEPGCSGVPDPSRASSTGEVERRH